MTDGRLLLSLHKEAYDVIISEPSNPWMAGATDLFTKQFLTSKGYPEFDKLFRDELLKVKRNRPLGIKGFQTWDKKIAKTATAEYMLQKISFEELVDKL